MGILVTIVAPFVAVFAVIAYFSASQSARRKYLAAFRMPDAVLKRFGARRPELGQREARRVLEGMRQYFEICQRAKGKFVSMPSQVVDDLWHEFILFTRNYELFCRKAFGCYLHHTPVEAMTTPTTASDGIRRTWLHACRIEGINPRDPQRLPLLFALDADLGIANGFHYALDCRGPAASSGSNAFCASSIGCGGASCGSSWDSSTCGAGAGGDAGGHGCGGGSGCGGGCGGGGD